MSFVQHFVREVLSTVQSLTPYQLLAAAVCTVLLGYLGILTRTART
jgi:hypothetical protein